MNFPVREREKRALLLDLALIRVGFGDLFKPAAQQGGALFVAVVQQGEGVLRAQHAREILHLAHEAALRLCEHRIDRAAAVFAEELQIHLVAQQKCAVEPDEVRPAGEQARHRLVRLGEAVLVHEAAAAENAGRGDEGVLHCLVRRHDKPFVRHIAQAFALRLAAVYGHLQIKGAHGLRIAAQGEGVFAVVVDRPEPERDAVREREIKPRERK